MDLRDHWNNIYQSKTDSELSWLQSEPAMSLSLIKSLEPAPRRVIDVGGGQSLLSGLLLNRYPSVEVTVLDISSAAMDRARRRLGVAAQKVQWIVADVLAVEELGSFDLWHDRAVFHFLTRPEDRRRYVSVAARAVVPDGHAIVATFAPTGPEKCSGLPVCRYDAASLAAEFGSQFRLVSSAAESHRTPSGKTQEFIYAILQRLQA